MSQIHKAAKSTTCRVGEVRSLDGIELPGATQESPLYAARAYTLEGVAQQITCPVLVCQAAGEHFNPGQAEKLAAALGDRATVRSFTVEESAAAHSHIGAFVLMNGVVLDWLAERLDAQAANDWHDGYRAQRAPAEVKGVMR